MAYDLFLKSSKNNWSRDLIDVVPVRELISIDSQLSHTSARQTAKIAAIKAAADKGDKKAQKKWVKICKKVAKIQKAARDGNADAAAQMAKINATGLFTPPAAAAMRGDDDLTEIVTSGDAKLTEILTSGGAFIGRQEILGKDEILGHNGFVGKDEILGRGQFIGEEERALAAEGGACERNALRRRFSSSGAARVTHPMRQLPSHGHISQEEFYHMNRLRSIPALEKRAAAGDAKAQKRLEQLRKLESEDEFS